MGKRGGRLPNFQPEPPAQPGALLRLTPIRKPYFNDRAPRAIAPHRKLFGLPGRVDAREKHLEKARKKSITGEHLKTTLNACRHILPFTRENASGKRQLPPPCRTTAAPRKT